MIQIFIFTEHEFDQICTKPTVAEARAFASGVQVGGGLYGAGSIQAYVLPDDEADMKQRETAAEIARAMQRAESKAQP